MAQAPQEMAEIAALAAAVVLNTGTPDETKFTAARLAGETANRRGVPVVLDPVGVGASHWRLEQIRGLLQCVHPDIVRVNYGEAAALLGLSAAEHGVDSLTVPTDAAACANALAERLGAVVLLSGEEDLVTDGRTLHTVRGGSPLMRRVTGAGCMLSVLCGAFAAVEPDALTAARHAAAVLEMLRDRRCRPGPRQRQLPHRTAGRSLPVRKFPCFAKSMFSEIQGRRCGDFGVLHGLCHLHFLTQFCRI